MASRRRPMCTITLPSRLRQRDRPTGLRSPVCSSLQKKKEKPSPANHKQPSPLRVAMPDNKTTKNGRNKTWMKAPVHGQLQSNGKEGSARERPLLVKKTRTNKSAGSWNDERWVGSSKCSKTGPCVCTSQRREPDAVGKRKRIFLTFPSRRCVSWSPHNTAPEAALPKLGCLRS